MLRVIYVFLYISKQKKLVNILLLLLISLTASEKCPSEYSSIPGTNEKALWMSDNIQHQIVVSKPPCFDSTFELITRVCVDGSWKPIRTPLCQKISNGTNTDVLEEINRDEHKNYQHSSLSPVLRQINYNNTVLTCSAECKISSTNSRCYCKSQNCQNIATIQNPNDKKIIQSLAGNEMCRLDKSRPNFSSLFGMHPYVNASVWVYGNFSTNCTICETSIETVAPKLVLSFEEKKHELYLVVYSPQGIHQDGDQVKFFCFTNAAKTSLKKRLDMVLIFNHSDSDPSFPNTLLVYAVEMEKYMGEYWCEAFTRNDFFLKSETVIAYKKKRGNEYALRLIIDNICKFSPCDLDDFFKYLTKKKLKESFREFNAEIRVMEMFKFDIYNDIADILVHVSTGKHWDIATEYYKLLTNVEKLRYEGITCIEFRSSEFCLPERTRLGHLELEWPLAKIHNAVVPKQFCLVNDGTPIIRQCQGSFLHGAYWSNVTGRCIDDPPISAITVKLRDMATSLDTSVEAVWNIVRHANLTVLDIYYLDIILEKFPDNNYALDFVNKLMLTDDRTLKKSQNVLNLADTTLDIIESIVTNLTSYPDLVYCTRKDNLIVHLTNPFQSNISGLLVYKNHVEDFQRGKSFDDANKENLELALYVPEVILEQILNETDSNITDVVLMTVVFYNDNFFVDDRFHSGSFVVSVSIPGYGTYLKSPIPILFKSKNHTHSNMCGFWDNGKRTQWKKGTWSVLGSNYVQNHTDDLHECSFIHLTHFALLVMSDKKIIPDGDDEVQKEILEDMNEYILEILTIIGCVFSGIGIIGLINTESYVSSSYELCYPRGMWLYATVLIPICLIMIANITVFCLHYCFSQC
ncbi:uncharacterized protein LOC135139742 [Zophobas morio]|uniref:uncharacterized protein LOC135139742 n=1 Tax=Zophobas morio TaxID=2755281 RepID=UPI003083C3CF